MILAAPNAPDGTILRYPRYNASMFLPGSAVLCRNTAPLVRFCYDLFKREVPCRILGKDIGADLGRLVESMHAVNVVDLKTRIQDWMLKEVQRAGKEHRSPERYADQYGAISVLCTDATSPDHVLQRITRLFTDDASNHSTVTLSTIHKAKGEEYPTVFLLDWHLLPSKYAHTEEQLDQERHLQYVAITRCMDTLIYINLDNWKE